MSKLRTRAKAAAYLCWFCSTPWSTVITIPNIATGDSMTWSGIATSLLFVSVLFAQSDFGTMTGTITDPDGGAVAGAVVQAKHIAAGMFYKAESSRTGTFTMPQLPA